MSEVERDFNFLRVLGIIPARGGSTRVPRKNLRKIGGRTLVERAIDCAEQSRCIHTIAVTSDDTEILEVAAARSGVLPMYRPRAMASNTSPAIEYVRHVWNALNIW